MTHLTPLAILMALGIAQGGAPSREAADTAALRRLATVWNACAGTARGNTVFGLTISGGSALPGARATPARLKSRTTTRRLGWPGN
jgi:hypothetical protein